MTQPKTIQISIPKPCTEDWHKMTPQEQGRFCDKCQKCVVDFTDYTDKELADFFISHRDKNICGYFLDRQLDRDITVHPERTNRFYRWFIGLGFIVFLSDIFGGEAKAQLPVCYTQTNDHKNNIRGTGSISGVVTGSNGKPIANTSITIDVGGIEQAECHTDSNGKYRVINIASGLYNISIFKEKHNQYQVTKIIVQPDKNTIVNARLEAATNMMDEVTIVEYKVPLIDGGSFASYDKRSEEIEVMGIRYTSSVVSTTAPAYPRADSSLYIIDDKEQPEQDNNNVIKRLWNKLTGK